MNYPAAEQRGINWNIHNRPKGGGLISLRLIKSLSGGLVSFWLAGPPGGLTQKRGEHGKI